MKRIKTLDEVICSHISNVYATKDIPSVYQISIDIGFPCYYIRESIRECNRLGFCSIPLIGNDKEISQPVVPRNKLFTLDCNCPHPILRVLYSDLLDRIQIIDKKGRDILPICRSYGARIRAQQLKCLISSIESHIDGAVGFFSQAKNEKVKDISYIQPTPEERDHWYNRDWF